ncbi:MAG: VPLPA-CTERM sorting domain-containing protein [Rhodobacteraceae bacterium]|nr:VPLPA-CTERM sorting domain-containing protein [Paracoccaceae bacterium]
MTQHQSGRLAAACAVMAAAIWGGEAGAVVFDAASLPLCFAQDSPFVPPRLQRTTIRLEMHYCEEINHFKAIFVGDRISPGESISLRWSGQYWRGDLILTQFINGGGNRELEAEGELQHLVPGGAPVFAFEDLFGGGTGSMTAETIQSIGGSVAHGSASDTYFLDLAFDEGRTFFNFSPGGSPNATERGWLLEIEGFHGPGPFDFDNPPKPFKVRLANIPLPAGGLALMGALFGLAALRRSAGR